MFKYVSFFCTFTTCAICECHVILLAFTASSEEMYPFLIPYDEYIKCWVAVCDLASQKSKLV